ncbi:MAG: hypothetical protein AAGD23_10980 [Pseudomonadota bacterium]
MHQQRPKRTSEAPNDSVRETAGVRAIEQLISTRNAHVGRAVRLGRLDAPDSVLMAEARTTVKWLNRALRVERGLAVRGAAQYSFTRHVALLRALQAERTELGKARHGVGEIESRCSPKQAQNAKRGAS